MKMMGIQFEYFFFNRQKSYKFVFLFFYYSYWLQFPQTQFSVMTVLKYIKHKVPYSINLNSLEMARINKQIGKTMQFRQ